jgi:hypothetical protein
MLGDLVNMQRPRQRGVNNRAPVNLRLSTFPGSSRLTGQFGGGDWHLPVLGVQAPTTRQTRCPVNYEEPR